ncbi:inositol monophosphatase family protein [Ornithinimicrobium sp. W1679]|uniref:inositol monophosphatase family protein n=1 Tax=unclassified Ornithinimicrobium TaxID=2615080 RepID=UPI003CE8D44F
MPAYDDDLRLAHVLADAVERTALDLFGSPDLQVSVGDDGSLTTQASERLETLLRHQLGRTRPRDRVVGRVHEETGQGDRRWVLDPVDGTANYVRGVPVWAMLISLVVEDTPVLGLVAAPSLSRRWWAGRGSGAWTGRTLSQAVPVRVSSTEVLAHASVSADEVAAWSHGPHGDGFDRLTDRVWRTRAFGDFWSHTLLAEGAVDVALAAWMDGYQAAPLSVLVAEAGGRTSTPDGRDVVGGDPRAASAVVATNGVLHEEVLSMLGSRAATTAGRESPGRREGSWAQTATEATAAPVPVNAGPDVEGDGDQPQG